MELQEYLVSNCPVIKFVFINVKLLQAKVEDSNNTINFVTFYSSVNFTNSRLRSAKCAYVISEEVCQRMYGCNVLDTPTKSIKDWL